MPPSPPTLLLSTSYTSGLLTLSSTPIFHPLPLPPSLSNTGFSCAWSSSGRRVLLQSEGDRKIHQYDARGKRVPGELAFERGGGVEEVCSLREEDGMGGEGLFAVVRGGNIEVWNDTAMLEIYPASPNPPLKLLTNPTGTRILLLSTSGDVLIILRESPDDGVEVARSVRYQIDPVHISELSKQTFIPPLYPDSLLLPLPTTSLLLFDFTASLSPSPSSPSSSIADPEIAPLPCLPEGQEIAHVALGPGKPGEEEEEEEEEGRWCAIAARGGEGRVRVVMLEDPESAKFELEVGEEVSCLTWVEYGVLAIGTAGGRLLIKDFTNEKEGLKEVMRTEGDPIVTLLRQPEDLHPLPLPITAPPAPIVVTRAASPPPISGLPNPRSSISTTVPPAPSTARSSSAPSTTSKSAPKPSETKPLAVKPTEKPRSTSRASTSSTTRDAPRKAGERPTSRASSARTVQGEGRTVSASSSSSKVGDRVRPVVPPTTTKERVQRPVVVVGDKEKEVRRSSVVGDNEKEVRRPSVTGQGVLGSGDSGNRERGMKVAAVVGRKGDGEELRKKVVGREMVKNMEKQDPTKPTSRPTSRESNRSLSHAHHTQTQTQTQMDITLPSLAEITLSSPQARHAPADDVDEETRWAMELLRMKDAEEERRWDVWGRELVRMKERMKEDGEKGEKGEKSKEVGEGGVERLQMDLVEVQMKNLRTARALKHEVQQTIQPYILQTERLRGEVRKQEGEIMKLRGMVEGFKGWE